MRQIIIIGMGQIGKRHLQSLSNLTSEANVACYDKNKEALESVQKFCSDNSIKISNIQLISDFDTIIEKISAETVVIVSSTAQGRVEVLAEVIQKKPLAVISEKPVTQNLKDYERIMKLSKEMEVPVYINFIAHMQPHYQKIYEQVKDASEFVFYTNLPNWGISCVGIHNFELFTWLFNVKEYKMIASNLKSVYEQKRKGFYDVAGSIVLETSTGNIGVVNNTENLSYASIQIITSDKVFNIFEEQGKIIEIDKKRGLQVMDLEFLHVSQYSNKVIEDIFSLASQPALPDIHQGYLAHKMLFEYLDKQKVGDLNFT